MEPMPADYQTARARCFEVDPRQFEKTHGCHPSAVEGEREWLYEIRWHGRPARDWLRATYRGPWFGLLMSVMAASPQIVTDGTLAVLD